MENQARGIAKYSQMGHLSGKTGNITPVMALNALKNALAATLAHEGEVFGATRSECGNYKELDIDAAKRECAAYLEVLKAHKGDFSYAE